jgi:nucleoid-associated protein YgaU
MGLIDFVKEGGRKLRGDEPDKGGITPPPSTGGQAAAAARSEADRRLAARLASFVNELGLEVADLGVRVEGETATVTGKAASQEVREKVVLAVGNVEGIGRVDDRMTVSKPEPEATFYTVKRGVTLSAIARDHYGNASKYPVIFEANRPMLTDPDKIYPGQVLRIPAQK